MKWFNYKFFLAFIIAVLLSSFSCKSSQKDPGQIADSVNDRRSDTHIDSIFCTTFVNYRRNDKHSDSIYHQVFVNENLSSDKPIGSKYDKPVVNERLRDMHIDSMYISLIDLDDNLEFSITKIYPDRTIRVLWTRPRINEWDPSYTTKILRNSVAETLVKLVDNMIVKKTIPLRTKDIPVDVWYSHNALELMEITIFKGTERHVYKVDTSRSVDWRDIKYSDEFEDLYYFLTDGRAG